MKFLISEIRDPYLNLAIEDFYLRQDNTNEKVIMLWRSDCCVVMGRFQNPYFECDLDFLKQKNISLVRRQSGGGCVFHDLGNTNWSFIGRKENFDKNENFSFIQDLLLSLGVNSKVNDRNDLMVDDRKISGSAFKQIKEKSLHHCTLLINTDLYMLKKSLKTHKKEKLSKAVKSVRSTTLNLKQKNPDIDFNLICQRVVDKVTHEGGNDISTINTNKALENSYIKKKI